MQVEQIDREAAAELTVLYELREAIRQGSIDGGISVQAFAHHRHQARAEIVGEIVAWLRESDEAFAMTDWEIADQIEAKFGSGS